MKLFALNIAPIIIATSCFFLALLPCIPFFWWILTGLVSTYLFVTPIACFVLMFPLWTNKIVTQTNPLISSHSTIINIFTIFSVLSIICVQIVCGFTSGIFAAFIAPFIVFQLTPNEENPWDIEIRLWNEMKSKLFYEIVNDSRCVEITKGACKTLDDWVKISRAKIVLEKEMEEAKMQLATRTIVFDSFMQQTDLKDIDKKYDQKFNMAERSWISFQLREGLKNLISMALSWGIGPELTELFSKLEHLLSQNQQKKEEKEISKSEQPLFFLNLRGRISFRPVFKNTIVLLKVNQKGSTGKIKIPIMVRDFSVEVGIMTLKYQPFGTSKVFTVHPPNMEAMNKKLQYIAMNRETNSSLYDAFFCATNEYLKKLVYYDENLDQIENF